MGGGRYPPLLCRAPGEGGRWGSPAPRRAGGVGLRPGAGVWRVGRAGPGRGESSQLRRAGEGAGRRGVRGDYRSAPTAPEQPCLGRGGGGGHRAEEPPAPFSGGNELQGLTTGFDSRDEGCCTAALSPPRHSLVPTCPRERSPSTEHARTPNDRAHGKLVFPLVGQKIGKTAWSLVGDARPGPQPAGTNVNSVWH